jgi:predicted ferric reductase
MEVSMNLGQLEDGENTTPVAGLYTLLLGILAILAGVLLATYILPFWLPGFTSSIMGESPKVFWYLSRGSAFVAFILLWASMALGLMITNKLARLWPGGPVAFEMHQYTSLLGLGFALFHATILIGDEYIQFAVWRVFTPFASQSYLPFWVGVGQIGFYIWGLLVGSFYFRKQIGTKTWRWIHFSSFLTFAMVLVHGIVSGTDSQTLWANLIYWIAGGSLLFLLYYRILVTVGIGKARKIASTQMTAKPEVVVGPTGKHAAQAGD